jgi:hypothetical protein
MLKQKQQSFNGKLSSDKRTGIFAQYLFYQKDNKDIDKNH